MRNTIMDSFDASHQFKKRLRRVNEKNIVPNEILIKIQREIKDEFVGRKIETLLGFRSLTIYSEKKKNAALGIIKDSIEGMLLSYIDDGDLDILFSIHKLDNRVIIESKRIIEQ